MRLQQQLRNLFQENSNETKDKRMAAVHHWELDGEKWQK